MLSYSFRGFAIIAVLIGFVIGETFLKRPVQACPFCNAVGQTLRQEMEVMDAVVIGISLQGAAARNPDTGEVMMQIEQVLKGHDLVQKGQKLQAIYYGEVAPGRRFMLSGVDPPDMQWSCLPLSPRAEEYLLNVTKLPEDDAKRLEFFYDFIQDEETMLSRDAYDEFAIAPYSALKQITPRLEHDKIVQWIQDPETTVDRKRLFLTMLGVCGSEQDLPMLESLLRSTQKSARSGLDAMIGCYLTLGGEKGLPLIDELFLKNKQASYADTYAAIMAIRFHGTEGDVMPRSALVPSLHLVLDRKDLADLVIPDLARWSDWSQIDKMKQLFLEADPDNNWVRVPVVNYLRACPLDEAAEVLEELKKVDPESVKRASTFFSIPVPAQDTSGSDASVSPKSIPRGSLPEQGADRSVAEKQKGPDHWDAAMLSPVAVASRTATSGPSASVRLKANSSVRSMPQAQITNLAQGANPIQSSNRWRLIYVVLLALSTIMIGQFLLLAGGRQADPR